MPFDENMPLDVQETLDVAGILQITEFQVFQYAYARWFGEVPERETLEPYFAAYMFNELVPPWVRQFTRWAMELYEKGELELGMFDIYRTPVTQEMITTGMRYAVTLVVTFVTLVVLVLSSDPLMAMAKGCYFPPCY